MRILGLALLLALVAGCTTTISGSPVAGTQVTKPDTTGGQGGVDPSFVHGTDNGDIDRLAATVITDVQDYWRETFPATFSGQQWRDIDGGFYSVDTTDADAEAPPCTQNAADVEGNAFYCPSADIVAWDRAALLPVLKERFGEGSIMLVFAHEIGHAVQRRSGITSEAQSANPEQYPTILIEAMADCYAGSFVRWVADGHAAHLNVSKDRLDSALESLIVFRDPVGTAQTDSGAHGDAFDRVSAFQDGYDQGAKLCAGMSVANRTFTQTDFLTVDDAQTGGNLGFEDMINTIAPELDRYYGTLVGELGKPWPQPKVTAVPSGQPCGNQGPILYCKDGNQIDIVDGDTDGDLRSIHDELGDYATGTILASRYGLATLAALGKPTEGDQTRKQVLCLSGAYTATLIGRPDGFTLSPGDLDEAVQVLLRYNYASRDSAGRGIETGYDRVSAFRTGMVQGATCDLP